MNGAKQRIAALPVVLLASCASDVSRSFDVNPTGRTLFIIVAEAEGRTPIIEAEVLGPGDDRSLRVPIDFGSANATVHLVQIAGSDLEGFRVPVLEGFRSLLSVASLSNGTVRVASPPEQVQVTDTEVILAMPRSAQVKQIYPNEAMADPTTRGRFSLVFSIEKPCTNHPLSPVGASRDIIQGSSQNIRQILPIDDSRLLLFERGSIHVARRGENLQLQMLTSQERQRLRFRVAEVNRLGVMTNVVEDPRVRPDGSRRFVAGLSLESGSECYSDLSSRGRSGFLEFLIDEDGIVRTASAAPRYQHLRTDDCFVNVAVHDEKLYVLSSLGVMHEYDLDGLPLRSWPIPAPQTPTFYWFDVLEDDEARFVVTSPGAIHTFDATREVWTTRPASDLTDLPSVLTRVTSAFEADGTERAWIAGDAGSLYVWDQRTAEPQWVTIEGDSAVIEVCLRSELGARDFRDLAIAGRTMILAVQNCAAVMIVNLDNGRVCYASEDGAPPILFPAESKSFNHVTVIGDQVLVSGSDAAVLSFPTSALD